MEEILNIQSGAVFDDSISHLETHAYQPYNNTSYNNSDEIRISIQNQEMNLLPSQSSIRIIGQLTKKDGGKVKATEFVNNGILHMFEEMRYELNGVEIDRCKNVGITTLLKGWPSCERGNGLYNENTGWIADLSSIKFVDDENRFDVIIPLAMIFGFNENYRKIIVNMKHELTLIRSRNDVNAVVQTALTAATADTAATYEDFKITITKIEWLMPCITPSNHQKIRLLRTIEKNKPIQVGYRSWELHEFPSLPTSGSHVWTIKTANQLEKPRFVIVSFQTARKNNNVKNASQFDICDLNNIKLFLNSQYYPYGNLNLDVARGQFASIFNMFLNFQRAYYGRETEADITKFDFIEKYPIIIIDCAQQEESLKNTPIDVRLEFDARKNFPANTAAYCLIIHDRIIEYNPVSGEVKKIV